MRPQRLVMPKQSNAVDNLAATAMECFHTDWGEMAYHQVGENEPCVVLLHGTGCDLQDWCEARKALPANQKSVAIDFRGHGRSSAPSQLFTIQDLARDVISLMDHLRIARACVAGHSLGGMVAIEIAGTWQRASALVLLEGWTNLAAAKAFTKEHYYGNLPATVIQRIQEKWKQTRDRFPSPIWNAFWNSVQEFDGREFLQRTTIPIYEVYGDCGRNIQSEHDLHVPPNPCIRWEWLEGCGHFLPQENPSLVAKIIIECVTMDIRMAQSEQNRVRREGL